MRKYGEKTEGSINEKSPKLNEETRKKTDHLFVRVEIVCKGWKSSETELRKRGGKQDTDWLRIETRDL